MRLSLRAAFLYLLIFLCPVLPAMADAPKFLVITDIHFNPFADDQLFAALQASPATKWPDIFEKGAGKDFPPRYSDSNFALLESSIDDAAKRIRRPDFVLYGGDFLAHKWEEKYDNAAEKAGLPSHLENPAAYRSFTTKTLELVTGMLRKKFPKAPLFATLGNNDSFCGDYQLEPNGKFLGQFARIWAPLIGIPRGREKSLARGGYYSAPLHGLDRTRLVVLNTVFFSSDYENSCGCSTQTPALDELRWLADTLRNAARKGENVWLLMHIPPGISSYGTAKIIDKDGYAVTAWQRELTSGFAKLVARYRKHLRIAFAGHTHMDDYRVIRLENRAMLLTKIVPAISRIFGNDPGYQVYSLGASPRAKGLDFETFRLANLSKEKSTDGKWEKEYDFSDAYGLGPLGIESVTDLAQALADDPDIRKLYTSYYPVEGAPQFDEKTFETYRCAILNLTRPEFERCYFDGEEQQALRACRSSVGRHHWLQFRSGGNPEVLPAVPHRTMH
jgi:sphingomyelin phosphodiesterase acid-like 3